MGPTATPDGPARPPAPAEIDALRALARAIRSRIVGGLVLALPIAITFGIIYSLYKTLREVVLDPIARLINLAVGDRLGKLPGWWEDFVSPLISLAAVAVILYVLGYFLRSRLHRAVDWALLRLPLVTIVYKAVRGVFQSLEDQGRSQGFKRVVLVDFPHPGTRALAFVTKTLRDTETGRTILCVCVLTGVLPPTGFTLFVPEEDVTDVDWGVDQSLQAIVSGGVTAPPTIRFTRPQPPAAGLRASAGTAEGRDG